MSIAPKDPNLEDVDLPGAEPQLTPESEISGSEISGSQSDQLRADNSDQEYAADAEVVRAAEARINDAVAVIRSLSGAQPHACVPPFSSSANPSWPQGDTANRPPNTSRRIDYDCTKMGPRGRSSLDPEVVPEPPRSVRHPRVGPLLGRFALIVSLAAVVAYGITMFPSFQRGALWPKGAKDSVASAGPHEAASEPPEPSKLVVGDQLTSANEPLAKGAEDSVASARHEAASEPPELSRLVVEDRRAFANEPLALGVSVAPAIGFGSILVGGLTPGTRLSAGMPVTKASWELPLRDLGGVHVYAPQNFIGVMNAEIELLAPTKKIIDSRAERLEWIAKADSLQRGRAIGSEGASRVVIKPMDPLDAIVLMQRGRDLLKNGDVALAQLAFRRVADAGIAEGALALATTYDPRYIAEHHLIGIFGDETKARVWYQRASQLGSAEADRILARTDSK